MFTGLIIGFATGYRIRPSQISQSLNKKSRSAKVAARKEAPAESMGAGLVAPPEVVRSDESIHDPDLAMVVTLFLLPLPGVNAPAEYFSTDKAEWVAIPDFSWSSSSDEPMETIQDQ